MFTAPSKGLLLAFAAGFAASAAALPHPGEGFLRVRAPPSAPALPAPEVFPPLRGKREEQGFGGLSALLSYDDAEYSVDPNVEGGNVVEIAQANITEIQASDDQVVIQQIQQTIIQASSTNNINDDKRIQFYEQNESEQSTVLLVVQQIQIIEISQGSIGGGSELQPAYALSALTANEGMGSTETIMITQVSILSATIIVTDNGGTGIGTGFAAGTGNAGTGLLGATGAGAGTGLAAGTGAAGTGAAGTGAAAATGAAGTDAAGTGAAAAETTKTVTVTVTDAPPSWTSTAPDPAETVASLVNGLVGDLLDGLVN